MKKTNVMLLFGGRSGEHEISCASAAGVMGALDKDRFNIIPVGITPSGQWILANDDPESFLLHGGHGKRLAGGDEFAFLVPALKKLAQLDRSNDSLDTELPQVDVVFPLLHGPYGEDGTIQGLLEMTGLNYVGCGVTSSAVCMDKHMTKTVLRGAGIAVADWRIVDNERLAADPQTELARLSQVGFPCFVKPCRAGSSLGINKVDSPDELAAAIAEAHRHDPRVIVETGQSGREIECAVLQHPDGRIEASLPGEIVVPEGDFYDYDTKYREDSPVQLDCPANLPDDLVEKVRHQAVEAFKAVAGEGLARVDFFVDTQVGSVTVNEINTMPGFTPYSMYPMMWQKTGLSYQELLSTLIEQALTRPDGMR